MRGPAQRPGVAVIGAGPAGLSVGVALRRLGLRAPIVDAVGGETAVTIDHERAIFDSLPAVLGVLLALVAAILFVAFRSLFIPLKAVLLVILTLAASLGGLLARAAVVVGVAVAAVVLRDARGPGRRSRLVLRRRRGRRRPPLGRRRGGRLRAAARRAATAGDRERDARGHEQRAESSKGAGASDLVGLFSMVGGRGPRQGPGYDPRPSAWQPGIRAIAVLGSVASGR